METSRSAGATRLLGELTEAVAARTRSGGVVHCDLSGGLDSTPLCYLAAKGPAEVIAHTGYNDDPGGRNDLTYARIALRVMPGVRHFIYSWDDQPEFFGGLMSASYCLDEPTQMHLAGPRTEVYVANARSRGARAYITGDGGDHLLHPLPSASHTLFRSNPLAAWRRIRRFQQLEAWPMGDTVRSLLDNRPYRAWLSDQVSNLRPLEFKKTIRSLDWDLRISLPRWLTRDAVDLITSRLRELAADVEPLGAGRALHGQYAMVLDGSRILRGAQQIASAQQVALESPFFDDRVIEACFSVRLMERPTPTELKPLMKLAMRGLLPTEFLARTGYETGGAQAARGLANHWDEILELCEESGLSSTGLVDMRLFRDLCRPALYRERDAALDATINCAAFLQAQRKFSSKSASAYSIS
ncbi:asparagine synthase-related protein [Nonomuraea sp. NPDC050451]|uniref:asparagine synthase-related protein n=1 Tax=Nonomuraea sp. NPDC050451 TaxID=3364364 RepID=UPI0037A8D095